MSTEWATSRGRVADRMWPGVGLQSAALNKVLLLNKTDMTAQQVLATSTIIQKTMLADQNESLLGAEPTASNAQNIQTRLFSHTQAKDVRVEKAAIRRLLKHLPQMYLTRLCVDRQAK